MAPWLRRISLAFRNATNRSSRANPDQHGSATCGIFLPTPQGSHRSRRRFSEARLAFQKISRIENFAEQCSKMYSIPRMHSTRTQTVPPTATSKICGGPKTEATHDEADGWKGLQKKVLADKGPCRSGDYALRVRLSWRGMALERKFRKQPDEALLGVFVEAAGNDAWRGRPR